MLCRAILVFTLAAFPAGAHDLRGHGGPVRALAAGEDGRIYSGSFDTRAIVWDDAIAARITRHHAGEVTAVLPLPGGGFASGGQDGQVAIWGAGPEPVLSEIWHQMPVVALAPWSGGLASGGWEGRIALWSGSGSPNYISAHDGQIIGLVAFAGGLASVGADMRLRLWTAQGAPGQQTRLSAPASGLATDEEALFLSSPDGTLRRIVPGTPAREVALSARPLLSVAAGEGLVATADLSGQVWLLNAETLETRATMSSGQGPIWALAIEGETVFTGGNDGLIRRWTLDGVALGDGSGQPDPTLVSPRGAEVFRACAVCHTLTPEDGGRAGPSLHGIFGRRIGTARGYDYSSALKSLDIVWTPQTVSELFEFGPDAYTPGSRMPEQRVPSAEDRRALIRFLKTVTR
jgi:cytochrome c